MNELQIGAELIEFARANLSIELADADAALKLDSLSIFTLVGYIENKYGVSLDDRELTVENFANVGSVAKLIACKAGAS